jgi:hypothetical protein
MEPLQTITAETTDKKSYGIRVLYWMLIWIVLTALLLWITRQFAVALIGMLVAFLPPVLFEGWFKKGLTKEIAIKFYPDSLIIETPGPSGGSIKESMHAYSDLSMIRAWISAKSGYSILRFYTKDGLESKYVIDNYSKEEKTIAYLVLQRVQAYNQGVANEEKVILKNR